MLVITLGNEWKFVDYRPIKDYSAVLSINYSVFVAVITAVLFVFAALGIAHLLIDDKLAVAGTKKLTLPRKVIAFLRDYKSEVKKITWPNFKFVVKNTLVVLVICAIIGAFIWVLDWGLAEILKLLLGA
ncbi:MAG: preprotein translocase subunit SecE [Clostridia bacterium]|nr:preprotein translocase subunit SecE [Clostridia bacterium]